MKMLSMKVDGKRKRNMKQVKIQITRPDNAKYYGLTHHSVRACIEKYF